MISILIPIYNGIEFIDESVNSIKQQTYQNWELLIGVNGHLKDSDIYQTAKKYECEKIKVYDFYNINGKSNTLNRMIDHCQYDWIALLDVDDIWIPTKLESQINFMNQYDVIGTQCKYFGDISGSPKIPFGDITQFNFLSVNPIINSSSLIRKELCYWEDNRVEDYDLWLRLWKNGKKFYNVESIQVMHRIHNKSFYNSKGNNLEAKKIIGKYID